MSTPTPTVRAALLIFSGLLMTGAAIWSASVGSWTARPVARYSAEVARRASVTAPPAPTSTAPVTSAAATGSSWDPSAVLFVLGAALLVALAFLAGGLIRQHSRAAAAPKGLRPEPPPAVPVPASVLEPDRAFDPRRAADYVIACWELLEQRAAERGISRRPEQTPTEFLELLQSGYPLEQGAASELLALYQRARFDLVRLEPDAAGRARLCVEVLLAGLDPAGTRR